MTMPKFEPVGYLDADGYYRYTNTSRRDIAPLYTADQLTEAYEAGKRDAIPEGLLESVAKAIYAQWRDNPKYVAWVEGGNSIRQDSARSIAKSAIEAAAPKGEE